MEIQNVNSENISKIGYDESSSTLEVLLHNGNSFLYSDIACDIYESFLSSYFKDDFYRNQIEGFFTCFQIR